MAFTDDDKIVIKFLRQKTLFQGQPQHLKYQNRIKK